MIDQKEVLSLAKELNELMLKVLQHEGRMKEICDRLKEIENLAIMAKKSALQ